MLKRIGLLVCVFFLLAGMCANSAYAEKLTPSLCREKVLEAAELLKTQGEAAFDTFRDPESTFRFGDGKGYVWVHDLDAVTLVQPIRPELEGKNLMSLRDVNGVYFFVAMNETVEDYGAGWVEYYWNKPGENVPSPKVSYVKLVEKDGESYVIGSGVYDYTKDDIREIFPDDEIYEEDAI